MVLRYSKRGWSTTHGEKMPIRRAILPHFKWNKSLSVFFIAISFLKNFDV
jgi:hypothetical protein